MAGYGVQYPSRVRGVFLQKLVNIAENGLNISNPVCMDECRWIIHSINKNPGVCGPRGVPSPGGAGGIPACTEADPPPPVNRMTDRCKNITFATSLRTVITLLMVAVK